MRVLLFHLVWGHLLIASLAPAQEREYFVPGSEVQKYAVILGGAGAGEKYADRIRAWTLKLYDTLTTDYTYDPGQMVLLLGRGEPDDPRISGPSREETIKGTVKSLKKTLGPGDQVFFFLAGHGTSDEEEAKFVVHGPDITGEVFASMLEELSEQDIIVVNTTSSSYPFCRALSGPGRVIISSTRSRAEKYDTIFPQYFIEALEKHAGDRDKNKRVSMWEALLFSRNSVEKWYRERDRLPTEHAVLDDNGNGLFIDQGEPVEDDGRLAQIAYLDLLPSESTLDIPAGVDISLVRELTARIRELERSVFLLRDRKEELPKALYQREMEALLIDLARTTRKLRSLKTASADPSH